MEGARNDSLYLAALKGDFGESARRFGRISPTFEWRCDSIGYLDKSINRRPLEPALANWRPVLRSNQRVSEAPVVDRRGIDSS